MRKLAAGGMSIALALVVLSGGTWGAHEVVLLVGYDPGNAEQALLVIRAAGGMVERTSPELGFAVVSTGDPHQFTTLVTASPWINYVEDNDATRIDGAQWNGAQWNGAQWNGAQWNGAQWNGAQWNAAYWTMKAYKGSTGTHLRYDRDATDPGIVWQWGSWAINAPSAWQLKTGSLSTKLCVIDSGVAWDHSDLAPNMWTGANGEHGWNAIDPAASAYDDAGHGTHIAGIAAGRVGNAFGIAGVGNAAIMAVKVLDHAGSGTEDHLAFGLVWCALNGADVAVMALSVTEPGPTLDNALNYAADRDVLLLASAGNAGPCGDCVAYPATHPRVLAVTAVDGTRAPADFASRGTEVDLAAPGVHVLGPFLEGRFVFGSGTSQAVAFAAGLAALVRDAGPALSADATRSLLVSTAVDIGAPGKDDATGQGLIAAELALQEALES